MDAGDLAVAAAGAGGDLFVIGLGAAGERGEQIHADRPYIELVEHAAGGGREQTNQPIVGEANFLASVEVVVIDGGFDEGTGFSGGQIKQVVTCDELVVDGVTEVRQINAAKRAVPVGAVALP